MILVPANATSEAGTLPDARQLAEMGKYNQALVEAGVLVAGEGLHPTSKGTRVTFDGTKAPTVVDGPFTESKDLIAGFWIFDVKSHAEAIEWIRKAPFGVMSGDRTTVEIRRIFSPEDFAPSDPTGELRAKEEELRERAAKQHAK
ncbi:MAG: YciI family protein [Polyangiales bacterium]